MGIRATLGFVIKGKRKGTYTHMDGYSLGLGKMVVRFINSLKPEEIDEMIRLLEEITWVDPADPVPDDLNTKYCSLGYNMYWEEDWSDRGWYGLLRALQGFPTLDAIKSGDLKHLIDFAIGGEWEYWIDFEKKTLTTIHSGPAQVATFSELNELGDKYMERMKKHMYLMWKEENGYHSESEEETAKVVEAAKNDEEEVDEGDDEEKDVRGDGGSSKST